MIDRRSFIRAGLAAPAFPVMLSSLGWPMPGAAASDTLQLERFIYDVRFTESYAVAQQLSNRGIALSGIADDLMALWYDDLDLRWKNAPMTLGGMTMPEATFVLETFALDRGMRVIYRGEHAALSNGKFKHSLSGPATMLAGISQAQQTWTDALAEAMTRCPVQHDETREVQFETDADGPSLRDVPLVSWIIAPRPARTTQ